MPGHGDKKPGSIHCEDISNNSDFHMVFQDVHWNTQRSWSDCKTCPSHCFPLKASNIRSPYMFCCHYVSAHCRTIWQQVIINKVQ
eukprot:9836553-Ditylum_brightwellii.AAC.1